MNIMEIVSNLAVLYITLTVSQNKMEDEEAKDLMENQLTALKRAMQILISVDLKNEAEKING